MTERELFSYQTLSKNARDRYIAIQVSDGGLDRLILAMHGTSKQIVPIVYRLLKWNGMTTNGIILLSLKNVNAALLDTNISVNQINVKVKDEEGNIIYRPIEKQDLIISATALTRMIKYALDTKFIVKYSCRRSIYRVARAEFSKSLVEPDKSILKYLFT